MIKTASQLLAEIEQSGVYEKPDTVAGEKWGKPKKAVARRKKPRKECSVSGCTKSSRIKGICIGHHYRLTTYGDVMANVPFACRCGQCPATVRRKQAKAKREAEAKTGRGRT